MSSYRLINMRNYRTFLKQSKDVFDVSETIRLEEKVAISDYHRLRKEVSSVKDYARVLLDQLENFEVEESEVPSAFRRNEFGGKILLVIGGEKGLVGDTHHRLLEKLSKLQNNYSEVYVVGRKMARMMSEAGYENVYLDEFSEGKVNALKMAETILTMFVEGRGVSSDGPVDVLYPSFVSVMEYVPTLRRVLPPVKQKDFRQESKDGSEYMDALYEPSRKRIFLWVLQRYMEVALYEILIEAQLSILTARMLSMENAATQAEGIATNLKASYSRERKREISQRQIEIFVAHSVLK